MLDMVKTFIDVLWALFKIPVYMVLGAFFSFIALCFVQLIYLYCFKKYRFKKGSRNKVKRKNFFYRFFIEAPRRVILDIFERDPDFFRYQGLHVFCGEQGSGKTIALVEFIMRIQAEYPKCRCITNLGYKYEDDMLNEWQQLLTYNNDIKGVVVGIDEIQNWFSSGRNTLPESMLEVVTQNRKNRRIILATSQVFTRMAKGLREQCTLIYEPVTFAGCITWVKIRKPVLDSDGNVIEKKRRGSYFFVHSEKLRDAYDTYKVIHALAKDGFKEQPILPEISVKNVINGGKYK
nr:zonular occludens toxin domain-containing protein [uncultured Acetatifactor sp.]